MTSGASAYGWEIPLLRVREVEIHHVDLDAGYTPNDWSPQFAARTLDQLSPFFRDARDCPVGTLMATNAVVADAAESDGTWQVAAEGPTLARPTVALAAWLVGRSPGGGLRLNGTAEVPPAPHWI